MKRVKVLLGQRRMLVLATMAVLLLAVGVIVASSASFTASSANAGNLFTAGNLAVSGPSGAILTASNMKPGGTASGSATISNTGNVSGKFYLTGVMNGSVTNYDSAFAHDLQLKVVEDGTTTIFNGPLDTAFTLPTVLTSNTAWAGGAAHTYAFTVTFPDNGVNGSGVGLDNAYMGKAAQIDLTWSAIADTTH